MTFFFLMSKKDTFVAFRINLPLNIIIQKYYLVAIEH